MPVFCLFTGEGKRVLCWLALSCGRYLLQAFNMTDLALVDIAKTTRAAIIQHGSSFPKYSEGIVSSFALLNLFTCAESS